jgi:acyl carrier protein phosphodiesterase
MADGIQDKQFETYPQEIQNGITLHRAIDTLISSYFLRKYKKLHSDTTIMLVIVDVFYDHSWQNWNILLKK